MYKDYYDELILLRGSKDKPKGYSERHHVIPKWMGGTNNKNNLIYLSFKDHVFAHWLLWKQFRDKPSAYSYYMMMKRKKVNPNPTVQQFAQTNKGRKLTQPHKDKIGLSCSKPKPEGFGKHYNAAHLRKSVSVRGVLYESNRSAGRALGVCHRTIKRMIDRGEAFLING